MAKLLLVEDDVNAAEMVATWLRAERYIVEIANDGEAGLEHLRMAEYDVVLLDWELPGLSGYEILRHLRASSKLTPVIMLTAKSEIEDKEKGLDGGADDYLSKPYSLKELSARIRTQLRRLSQQPQNELILRGITLIPDQLRVKRDGKDIALLPKEFSLLEFFMRNPDRVFSAEAVMSRVWPAETEVSTNAFRSALKRLRQKLNETDEQKPLIETVLGAGYRFNSSE
jgi:DNA-binding response OmpR family regulator